MSLESAAAAPRTVGEWLAQVQPAPPPALFERLLQMLATDAYRPAADTADACVTAGERALETMLLTGATSRDSALDLLAVDSLITYAFQAAADTPELIEQRASDAMRRIAALPDAVAVHRAEVARS